MKTFTNMSEAETYLQEFITAVANNIYVNDLLKIERTANGNVYVAQPEQIVKIVDELLDRRKVTGNYMLSRTQPAYPEFNNINDNSLNFNFKMNLNFPNSDEIFRR